MDGRILIVGAGANQIRMIQAARRLGLYVVAADGNAEAPGREHADRFEAVNILDGDALMAVASEYDVDGIYPAAEFGVEAAAYAAETLGLPGVSPEVAARVRNKLVMRESLRQGGVPVPAFQGVASVAEARLAAGAIGLPLIVKPADGNASKGVRRIDELCDLPRAFEDALARTRTGIVLLERFMEGEEFGVDGLVHEGGYSLGGITAKELSRPPDRFDLGVYMPPEDNAETDRIVECVSNALQAIGFHNGTTHIEVIVTDDGPRIVEMAGRPGGGRIPTDLIPLTYGQDYMADSFAIALGQAPVVSRPHVRGAAIFWLPAEPGNVVRVEGVEEARRMPGVEDIVLAVRPGDVLEQIVDCATRDRTGYVLASGAGPAEAVANAKRACGACRIVTA